MLFRSRRSCRHLFAVLPPAPIAPPILLHPQYTQSRSEGFPGRDTWPWAHWTRALPDVQSCRDVDAVAVDEAPAGVDGALVVDRVRRGEGNFGYNARTEVFEDLHTAGVIDPTKVTRVALENAVSISGMVLTTECVIADVEDPAEMAAAAAAAAGAGGMGGMM